MTIANTKIAVLGASGMLGYAVSEYFRRQGANVKNINRSAFDIVRDPIDILEQALQDCEVIINCAGVIKPRIANNSVEDVIRVNSVFPRNLALLSKKMNLKCIHITTDCVYSGKKGNYTEDDYFDADDLYGLSKNAGEATECMVLRTSIIGEEKGQSRSLLEWARSQAGKSVRGFTNHLWNGVTTTYLAEIIETILNKSLFHKGIFHIHSPETVNKYELLQLFNDIYELDLTINPAEAPGKVNRSLATVYSLNATVTTKSLRRQIEEMREFFASEA